MAKTVALSGSDLIPARERAARQRGAVPSDDLVPLQFRMPAQFVEEFKVTAARRRMKLNQLLKTMFTEFNKSAKKAA